MCISCLLPSKSSTLFLLILPIHDFPPQEIVQRWLGTAAAGCPMTEPHKSMQSARLRGMQFLCKVAKGTQAQGSTLSEALRAGGPAGRELPSSEARRARSWSTHRIAPVAALSASASCSVLSEVWAACAGSDCCAYVIFMAG